MRCPECSLRNSIAARKCTACGKALPRKPLPLFAKIFLGGTVGLASIFCLTALCTTIDSPEKQLIKAAGEITGKSKSAEQAMNNFGRFDKALQVLLQKFGTLSTGDLRKKLAESLPKSLYEAHVFEISPDVKLVEIDTALNVADYLILERNEKAEVSSVSDLQVYDSSALLPATASKQESSANKPAGQTIVLLGHTAGANGCHPTVRVLFLNSANREIGGIIDLTEKVVPIIYGEGTAKLAANQKDIDLSLSLLSCGQDLKLFNAQQNKPLPIDNETLYDTLIWANDRYELRSQQGSSKLYAIFAALSALENHHTLWRYRPYFTNNVRRFIERTAFETGNLGFVIEVNKLGGKQKGATTSNAYSLSNGVKKVTLVLKYVPGTKKTADLGGKWIVEGLAVAAETRPLKQIINLPTAITGHKATADQGVVAEKPANAEKSEQPVSVEQSLDNNIVPCNMQGTFYPDIKASIKIRSGPGTSYKILHQLKPGSTVAITGRSGSWCRVDIDGKEGYVFGGLINTAGSTSAGYQSARVFKASLIKDENGQTVAHAYKGEHLVILSSSDKQYKVMLVDGKGGYLDKEATEPAVAVKTPAVKKQ